MSNHEELRANGAMLQKDVTADHINWDFAPDDSVTAYDVFHTEKWYRLEFGVWQFWDKFQGWTLSKGGSEFHQGLIKRGDVQPKGNCTPSFRVLKYQLSMSEDFAVKLPVDFSPVRIAGVDGFVYIWGTCSTTELTKRKFKACKTGGYMGDIKGYTYVGCGSIHIQMELMMYYFMKDA